MIESPPDFTEKTGGSIMKEVSDFIKRNGFEITDRGFGGCGGHIGCPCTDEECEELLVLLHIKFKRAIESGIIMPKIQWFKPSLFRNDNEIEKWIDKHKDEIL